MTSRYERMAGSGDPLVREIGGQLRLGQITPAGLLAVPEYRQVIQRGLVRLGKVARARSDGRAPSGVHDEAHRLGA